jgi:hypothetical protein
MWLELAYGEFVRRKREEREELVVDVCRLALALSRSSVIVRSGKRVGA